MTLQDAPSATERVDFQTHPDRYRHWRLALDGDVATLTMAVELEGGERPGYDLKLNSYDLAVDIELADATQRLRFEHPEVRTVVVTGGLDRVFCAGANINMLATSSHAFKVNFCKYTNETRLYLEDASAVSNKRFLAALNGTASGGGYELALACDRILLVDDRNSAVSFPELPLLGVLPGTGGLTRITDKRKIRRDRNDAFNTIAEGIKGKRAVEWDLVDRIAPLSKWEAAVGEMAREMADEIEPAAPKGITLRRVEAGFGEDPDRFEGTYVRMELDRDERRRCAAITLTLPDAPGPTTADEALAAGDAWWIFAAFRELDLALLELRLNEPSVAMATLRVVGDPAVALATDELLRREDAWITNEVRHFVKRVIKRLENTAKSFYAIVDEGTAFAGTFLELALACDRTYVLNDPDIEVRIGIGHVHAGLYPMANGLTRLETRFLGTPDAVGAVLAHAGQMIDAETADGLGLATFAPDEIDWDDELRMAIEERAAFSPDALTGLESNLRWPGPETMETKIFGRLSAWQNWIFQRPNAVGERGALKCYGTPQRAEFDMNRT
ncbi:MAG: 2,3-epoxybenzoyl-CoA dihydrolase [Planctomycetota bacterium]